MIIILSIYIFFVLLYCFFAGSELNKVISTKFVIAQLYAFPLLFGIIFSFVAIIVLLLIFFGDKVKYFKKISFKFWSIFLIFSLVFAFFGVDSKSEVVKRDLKTIKIVEWNVYNNINKQNINEIFNNFDADIVAFAELSNYKKEESSLEYLFKINNLNIDDYTIFTSSDYDTGIAPVSIIVKNNFGHYKDIDSKISTTFGTIILKPMDSKMPTIIGLHTAPPLPFLMDDWRSDLNIVGDMFINYDEAIIMGDFNATLRHGAMNDLIYHEDSLNYLSSYKRGTWPTKLPSYFRSTIDHIFIPKDKYKVKSIEIKNFDNSDHSCVLLEIYEIK